MPRKHDPLFGHIATFAVMHEAAMQAIKGKRSKPGEAAFMANLEKELVRLERQLNSMGRVHSMHHGAHSAPYQPGTYTVIEIQDPKPRRVSAAPFRDRVVHHALCAVVVRFFLEAMQDIDCVAKLDG